MPSCAGLCWWCEVSRRVPDRLGSLAALLSDLKEIHEICSCRSTPCAPFIAMALSLQVQMPTETAATNCELKKSGSTEVGEARRFSFTPHQLASFLEHTYLSDISHLVACNIRYVISQSDLQDEQDLPLTAWGFHPGRLLDTLGILYLDSSAAGVQI